MLFSISENSLIPYTTAWTPTENEIELLLHSASEDPSASYQIFKEPILILGRQIMLENPAYHKSTKKRLDLLAIDTQGNGIIIELKRDSGYLGMETQALTYISMIAPKVGMDFLNLLNLTKEKLDEKIDAVKSFCRCDISDLNKKNRLILMAQDFDPAVYSIGSWLSENGISFKCISFRPLEVDNKKFLNFSVSFEDSPLGFRTLQVLKQARADRSQKVFWHNIGYADQNWWDYLQKEQIITSCFENLDSPTSRGYQLLSEYAPNDKIFAYATGYGAVGFGVLPSDAKQQYKDHGLTEFTDQHYHRMPIKWKVSLPLKNAITPSELRSMGLYHPYATKQGMGNEEGALKLAEELARRVSK
jgi:hypothetical protein